MPSQWGQAIGGIAEFLKLQRGLQQNTQDREMRETEFKSGQERDRVLTEGANLTNTEARARIARQPRVDAETDFDNLIRRVGIHNVGEAQIDAYIGGDPTRLAQKPELMKAVADARARQTTQDTNAANTGKLTTLQIQDVERKVPAAVDSAKRFADAKAWYDANPNADPLKDRKANEVFTILGIPTTAPYETLRRDRMAEIYAGRPNYGAAEEARLNAQDRRRAQTLPPGVDIKTASIFDVLATPLITNINNSMANIERMKRDYTPADKTGIAAQMSTGNGPSAAAQANQAELIRLSDALHLEADSIIGQMRKAGVPAGSPGEEWARTQLRQYLATVPKFWNGQIVGGARTGVAGPTTTKAPGSPQLSNQGR